MASVVRFIVAIWLSPGSVNQRLPSGPAARPPIALPAVRPKIALSAGSGKSLTTPVLGLIIPIEKAIIGKGESWPDKVVADSANQRLPSGPVVMSLT